MKHTIVYQEPGRYAGWPANYGIWGFGDEIVVGFTAGYYLEDGGFHARDRSRPFTAMLARSMDGGLSWSCEPLDVKTPGNGGLSVGEHTQPGAAGQELHPPVPLTYDVDMTDLDFAMLFGRKDLDGDASSWFYISRDRCRTWDGPFRLDRFGQVGIAARTDYLVLGAHRALIFLTAQTVPGEELGSRVFVARTEDGGKSHHFLSWIDEPADRSFSIMPAGASVRSGKLLVANRIRKHEDDGTIHNYIDLYESADEGASWRYVTRPVADTGNGGNPPTLTALRDGRLVITYGYRNQAYGIRARISGDEGRTWGEEIIIREDAGNHDIGYCRAYERPDGKLVIVYYYNDAAFRSCYIAATLWDV